MLKCSVLYLYLKLMTTSVNNILIMLQKSIHEGDNYYDGMLLYKVRKDVTHVPVCVCNTNISDM